MNAKQLINQAVLVSFCISLVTAVLPGGAAATTAAATVTGDVYQPSSVTSAVYQQLSQANSASAASCTPYGPWGGYQYDPNLLMQKMGQPRTGLYGPFLSAHRGAWGTDPGLPEIAAENSITAIDNAAKLKFEMVELDVKVSGSGDLVLMHDYTAGRTTDVRQSDGHWDVFNQKTPGGVVPVLNGNTPPKLTDTNWNDIKLYNPLIINQSSSDLTDVRLRNFNKTVGTLGNKSIGGATVTAKGSWTVVEDKIPTLKAAMQHIGENYPGMTVVLDLRHLDEVQAAMDVVDQVSNCQGTPAKDWVIFKPFANVFPDGFCDVGLGCVAIPGDNSVLNLLGNRALKYKWIPVVSNRLVPPTPKGDPSVIPGAPGPDPSQIGMTAREYLKNWKHPNVVTFENGFTGDPNSPLKEAYDWANTFTTNMQSWRPPDIDVESPVINPENGKTIIGFNWKDDGMGAYPVYKESYKGYEKARETAGIITVEDAAYVLKMEVLTREATQMAISNTVVNSLGNLVLNIRKDVLYKLIDANSGKALDVNGNHSDNGTPVQIYDDNGGEAQVWRLEKILDRSYFKIIHQDSGKVLTLNENHQTEIRDYQSSLYRQEWNISTNFDGTFGISLSAGDHDKLGPENSGTANNTRVVGANGAWLFVPVANYMLQDYQTGLTIDVDHAGTNNGTTVLLYDPKPTAANQKWRFLNNGDGTYTAVNPIAASRVLDITDAGTAENTSVIIYDKKDTPNQKWELDYNRKTGAYTLINPYSGKLLSAKFGDWDQKGDPLVIHSKSYDVDGRKLFTEWEFKPWGSN